MKKPKNLIFTTTDEKFGDFTINHWLKSLKENVNLDNIDILVLDYGMNEAQINLLKKQGVIVKKCIRDKDWHVTIARYRDIIGFLNEDKSKHKNKYYQILSTDGGDVIFQEDISHIFKENKDKVRVVSEINNIVDFYKIYTHGFFRDNDIKSIKSVLNEKKMINVGVIFASVDNYLDFSEKIIDLLIDKSKFGPEQVALNYLFYKDNNFKLLDEKYNFIPATSEKRFEIKKGIFYFKDGKIINIIHNTGGIKIMRPIKNFGYGKEYNKVKRLFFILRALGKLRNLKIFKH